MFLHCRFSLEMADSQKQQRVDLWPLTNYQIELSHGPLWQPFVVGAMRELVSLLAFLHLDPPP